MKTPIISNVDVTLKTLWDDKFKSVKLKLRAHYHKPTPPQFLLDLMNSTNFFQDPCFHMIFIT